MRSPAPIEAPGASVGARGRTRVTAVVAGAAFNMGEVR